MLSQYGDASHRAISEADAAAIAEKTAAALIDKLSDPATVAAITDAWSGQLDRYVGHGLRRLALYVLIGVISLGALKFDLFSKLLAALGKP